MSEKLKPCPFCGMDEPDWFDHYKSKDEAVAAWNRRHANHTEKQDKTL